VRKASKGQEWVNDMFRLVEENLEKRTVTL